MCALVTGVQTCALPIYLLREAVAQGPSENRDVLASRSFTWLVEDLRDGRTPMEARKQWFVQDPDHLRFPTADLLAGALASGDIAGTLAPLDQIGRASCRASVCQYV